MTRNRMIKFKDILSEINFNINKPDITFQAIRPTTSKFKFNLKGINHSVEIKVIDDYFKISKSRISVSSLKSGKHKRKQFCLCCSLKTAAIPYADSQ